MGRLYNMGTTAEKLYRILDSKRAIKEALEAKGVVITDETTFSEYADLINEIVQGAISDADALTFIMDVAEGKRKIARAVRNKYEGTKGEASEITEYSTFDELSDKIREIPIDVKSGNASFQNEFQKDENTLIKLPFFDVYNETLKAMASVGTEFNGCCAFELDKWSYDNDHKVTLCGADAYYTSDGTFIDKDFNISENGTGLDKIKFEGKDAALYPFKDTDKENTNRFVVFFFTAERYTVPKCLHATSCLNLWCVKGTPLMNFNGDFTALNSINVYDGEGLIANGDNEALFYDLNNCQRLNLSHIKEVNHGKKFFKSENCCQINLNNLEKMNGSPGSPFISSSKTLKKLYLPKLKYIKGNLLNSLESLKELNLPSLYEYNSRNGNIIYIASNLKRVDTRNLTTAEGTFFSGNIKLDYFNVENLTTYGSTISNSYSFLSNTSLDKLNIPKFFKTSGAGFLNAESKVKEIHFGDGMKDGVAGDIRITYSTNTALTTLTVAEGFKAKLNLTGCDGLERDVLLGIINNLGQLDAGQTLNLIMGTTLLNKLQDAEAQEAIENAQKRGWSIS